MTEETKRKIGFTNSIVLKGQRLSEETKRKMSISRMGRIVTEETRNKISLGHCGKKLSKETKQKIGVANLGKKQSEEQIEKRSGKNNHNWRGDNVTYGPLHRWIERKLGRGKMCGKCGITGAKKYHWHNINGEYTREFTDWIRLCSHCHMHIHKNWENKDKIKELYLSL